MYDVTFQTEKSIKIKIEVDTCPPLNFKTEQKLLLQPHSFMTRCFTLPDLFAGKMHALDIVPGRIESKDVTGTTLNGMCGITFYWISLISQSVVGSSIMRESLQNYSKRGSLNVLQQQTSGR